MRLLAGFACLFVLLTGCSQSDPVTLGFIGGLTGTTADLGGHSRNGMIMAVEEWNKAGGIRGKPIQTLIQDDKQNEEFLKAGMQTLLDANVDAIVGPSTSTMAMLAVPIANEAEVVLFGTSVATNDLNDLDDYFFRTITSTREAVKLLADYLTETHKPSSFAIVIDLSNPGYSLSWRNDFVAQMENDGVAMVFEDAFTAGNNLNLLSVSQRLALIDADLLVLVSNARESALLVKQIRSINEDIIIATSAWSGSQQFLQLAGRNAEGVIVPRYIDDQSDDDTFNQLRVRYRERFQTEMGHAALLAYNSTNALLNAINSAKNKQGIKQALLEQRTHEAALATFELNEYGDEIRNAFQFISIVEDGKFVTVKE